MHQAIPGFALLVLERRLPVGTPFCKECCAGVFIVRNTPWSRQFLDLWLAAGRSMNGGKYFDTGSVSCTTPSSTRVMRPTDMSGFVME